MKINKVSHWILDEYIYLDSSGSAWHDETSGIPKEGWGSNPEDLEWGQNSGTISGNSQQGNAGITNFLRCGGWS